MNSVEEMHERLDWDFITHTLGEVLGSKAEMIRQKARELGHMYVGNLPPGREQSQAITNLETSLFYAIAALARIKEQV